MEFDTNQVVFLSNSSSHCSVRLLATMIRPLKGSLSGCKTPIQKVELQDKFHPFRLLLMENIEKKGGTKVGCSGGWLWRVAPWTMVSLILNIGTRLNQRMRPSLSPNLLANHQFGSDISMFASTKQVLFTAAERVNESSDILLRHLAATVSADDDALAHIDLLYVRLATCC